MEEISLPKLTFQKEHYSRSISSKVSPFLLDLVSSLLTLITSSKCSPFLGRYILVAKLLTFPPALRGLIVSINSLASQSTTALPTSNPGTRLEVWRIKRNAFEAFITKNVVAACYRASYPKTFFSLPQNDNLPPYLVEFDNYLYRFFLV